MLGKLVLCTVLCLFLNQVCLARPQQANHENDVQVHDSKHDSYGLTKVTSCRNNLRLITYTISQLAYNFSLFYIEILAAAIESFRCLVSGSVVSCGQTVVRDTIDGFSAALSEFGRGFGTLGQNLMNSVRSCVLSRNSIGYQQLFLDLYK